MLITNIEKLNNKTYLVTVKRFFGLLNKRVLVYDKGITYKSTESAIKSSQWLYARTGEVVPSEMEYQLQQFKLKHINN